MSRETYIRWMNYLNTKPDLVKWMHLLDQLFTALVFGSYPILLWWCFFQNKEMLIKAVLVPGISFVLMSLFRYLIDRPRPYTAYETPSAIYKETAGASFPSRHIFSVFVLAGTWGAIYPSMIPVYILYGIGILMAFLRVASGVHYISDVAAGALLGIIASLVGFSLG